LALRNFHRGVVAPEADYAFFSICPTGVACTPFARVAARFSTSRPYHRRSEGTPWPEIFALEIFLVNQYLRAKQLLRAHPSIGRGVA
jgi:hypothetical protein